MSESITRAGHGPSRGAAVGHVAFLFGLADVEWLPGTGLRALLADLGVSETAARALLARMQQHGQLESVRDGRRANYRLAGDFAAGFRRIRRRGEADSSAWTGAFHTLLLHVPESDRAYRDQLRRAALLAGYGVLQPGVLICPTDRREAIADVLAATPRGALIRSGTLTLTDADAADAVSVAWDLPTLAREHRRRIRRLTAATARQAAHPLSGAEALRLSAELVGPAFSATLLAPAVPATLMPAAWPGRELRDAAVALLRALSPVIDAHLAEVLGTPAA